MTVTFRATGWVGAGLDIGARCFRRFAASRVVCITALKLVARHGCLSKGKSRLTRWPKALCEGFLRYRSGSQRQLQTNLKNQLGCVIGIAINAAKMSNPAPTR